MWNVFFERLLKLWTLFSRVWPNDPKTLELDFQTACLLSNYNIECNELQTIENNYAKNLFYQRKKKDEDKRERRRISNQNYSSRRQTSTAVDIYLPEHIDYTL